LHRFSALANNWTTLFPSGSGPSPRIGVGFAATPNGMLYVFGGLFIASNKSGGQLRWMGPVAWDAVMWRARAALLLFLSFEGGEGTLS
jgi:hypothetical protein